MTNFEEGAGSRLKPKDKWTISIAILAMIASMGSFGTAAVSCVTSREATEVSRQVADNVKYDISGWYLATFTLETKAANGQITQTPIGSPAGAKELTREQAIGPDNWIHVLITNTGNRTVTIRSIGLVTDTEKDSGFWITEIPHEIPPYCKSNNGSKKDVRCWTYPAQVGVGASSTFSWWVPDATRLLRGAKYTAPIVIGIRNRSGVTTFDTVLTIR
ncbi:hypothetical protein [Nocardia sp. NPDC052566]|uniref:hypothetical protein n=1 Tax=Nocardia sp. NPDC052566 TaxID=3364330 RepID=UPI0037C64A74